MSRRSGMHGFTLIELVIVVALLAIIVSIATPNLSTFIRNNQLQGNAEELQAFLQYARSSAVANRQTIRVTVGSDQQAWTATAVTSQAVLRQFVPTPAQANIRASFTSLEYSPNGTAESARLTLCRDTDSSSGYLITISASGATQLHARGTESGQTLGSCTP